MSYFFILFLIRRHAFYKQFGSGGTILLVIFESRRHFIGYFQRGEANLSGKFWRRLVEIFIYIHNYAGCWPEVDFMVHALPGGLVIQIKLFYRCDLMLMFSSRIAYSIRVSGIPSSSVGSAGPISSTAPLLVLAESSDKFVFFLLGLDKSGMSEGTV